MTINEKAKDYAEHNLGMCTNEFGNIYNAYMKGAKDNSSHIFTLGFFVVLPLAIWKIIDIVIFVLHS